ncbi:hypothetical protein [Arthrobacter sp. UYEF20]|uniref:hypothetical protein n=1 Tax=Arthrobacter sp. UYEF20 TaxID=1756363 RepID=UPI003391A0E7
MAIAVILDFPGATLEQFVQAHEQMGHTLGGPNAPGSLFHWAAATDGGIRVTDVWKSREEFDAFAQEQIGPITAEAGMPTPTTTFYEVDYYLTAGQ